MENFSTVRKLNPRLKSALKKEIDALLRIIHWIALYNHERLHSSLVVSVTNTLWKTGGIIVSTQSSADCAAMATLGLNG